MPITACFACMTFVAVFLLIPIVPISLILLGLERKRAAITLLGIPATMIGLSVLATISVFVLMWLYGVRMSRDPDHLFEDTFGFSPPAEAEVLETDCRLGMDWEYRAMKFRAPLTVIKTICGKTFISTDRETFISACRGNDVPDRVASWFLPCVEQANHFYIAKPFDKSFSTWNQAVLCYDEKTGVACFHWFGAD